MINGLSDSVITGKCTGCAALRAERDAAEALVEHATFIAERSRLADDEEARATLKEIMVMGHTRRLPAEAQKEGDDDTS